MKNKISMEICNNNTEKPPLEVIAQESAGKRKLKEVENCRGRRKMKHLSGAACKEETAVNCTPLSVCHFTSLEAKGINTMDAGLGAKSQLLMLIIQIL